MRLCSTKKPSHSHQPENEARPTHEDSESVPSFRHFRAADPRSLEAVRYLSQLALMMVSLRPATSRKRRSDLWSSERGFVRRAWPMSDGSSPIGRHAQLLRKLHRF